MALDGQVLGHQRGHRGRGQLGVPQHQVARDGAAGQADRAHRPAPVGRRAALGRTAADPGVFQRQLTGDSAAAQQRGALPAAAGRLEVLAGPGVPGQLQVAPDADAVREQRRAAAVGQPRAAQHEVAADCGPGQVNGRLAVGVAGRVETVQERADAGAAAAHRQSGGGEGRAGVVGQAGAVEPEFAGHLGTGQLDQAVRPAAVEFAAADAQRVNPGPVGRDGGQHAGVQEKPGQFRVTQAQRLVEAASGKSQPDSGGNAVEVELTANQGTADHHATRVNYLRRIGSIGASEDIADAARVERPATAEVPDLFQARWGEFAAIVKPRTISGIAD